MAGLGVPKATLRFANLLEGRTEFAESRDAHSYGLLRRENTDECQLREVSGKTTKWGLGLHSLWTVVGDTLLGALPAGDTQLTLCAQKFH